MPPLEVTPEQIALQKAKKEARAKKKAEAAAQAAEESDSNAAGSSEAGRRRFLKREWIDWKAELQLGHMECRELFPGSDCLRWSDRKHMLLAELETYRNEDVICFQECDRLEDLSHALPAHSAITATGRGKQHGCVILYRSDQWTERASRVVHLDEEELCPQPPSSSTIDKADLTELRKRRGGSRRTKNVALITALASKEGNDGVIVATTHLFWHPKYIYERVRQIIIIIRSIRAFQEEYHLQSWPVFFAGDLNTSPSEAPYQLLANPNGSLHQTMLDEFEECRHLHSSVEQLYAPPSTTANGINSTAGSGVATPAEPDNDREDEPPSKSTSSEDKIPNPRPPIPEDGILEIPELVELMRGLLGKGATSVYGSSNWSKGKRETFGGRGGFEGRGEQGVNGWEEPGYTSFTPIWHLTLDYVFIIPPIGSSPSPSVLSVLRPATKEELGAGLPRKGVCASDHLAVGCRLSW